MKTQSSFQTALAALESNTMDAEAVKALRICEAADDLLDMVYRLLPFIEDMESDPGYKAGAVKRTIREIHTLITKAKGE